MTVLHAVTYYPHINLKATKESVEPKHGGNVPDCAWSVNGISAREVTGQLGSSKDKLNLSSTGTGYSVVLRHLQRIWS